MVKLMVEGSDFKDCEVTLEVMDLNRVHVRVHGKREDVSILLAVLFADLVIRLPSYSVRFGGARYDGKTGDIFIHHIMEPTSEVVSKDLVSATIAECLQGYK